MAKQSKTVSLTTRFKATKAAKPTGDSSDESDKFLFGWEGLSTEPLIDEARKIVDDVWPNTDTPDVVNGVWDDTPIMRAVLVALRRGIELGRNGA